MPPFPKPKVDYRWDVDEEVAALRDYQRLPGKEDRELWGSGDKQERTRFFGYVQYYLSDHRPLWMALKV